MDADLESMGVRMRELPGARTELTFPMLIPRPMGEDGEAAPMDMAQMLAAQTRAQLMAAALIDAITDAVGQQVDEQTARAPGDVQEGGDVDVSPQPGDIGDGDGSGEAAAADPEEGTAEGRNPMQSPQMGEAAAAAPGEGSPDTPRLAVSPSFREMLMFLRGLHMGPIAPPPWAGTEWRRILELSMADSGGMKKVASEEGLDEVRKWVYKAPEGAEGADGEDAAPVQVCAITQTPFEDGDEVAEMPCGHKFDSDSLMRWLQRESAACPVCRKEVASREVARTPEGRASSTESEEGRPGPPPDAALLQPLLPDGMAVAPGIQGIRMRVYNPAMMAGIRGPQRRLGDAALERIAEIEQQIEDDQIEEAILQAVMRDSMADV